MVRILVALGGNALARSGGDGSWREAIDQFDRVVPALAEIVSEGHELVLTHGNGPQVGQLLRQNELSAREVPPRPLAVLGAETQAWIGFLIQQRLSPALSRIRKPRTILPVVSRVVVDRRDPAFRKADKPVGRFYEDVEARRLRKLEGWSMVFDGARGGWRRVVPSPRPKAWLEAEAVRQLLSAGGSSRWIPVVTGGGGIPISVRSGGRIVEEDAVIDKDRAAALAAKELDVHTLAIVTDVPAVAIGFGRSWERWLGQVELNELSKYYDRGEFAPGSMGPKVEASLNFLREGGRRAIITDIPSLSRALRGDAGTRVER